MTERPVGILAMAYGTASGPDDVERYYTDIRGGRKPSARRLAELKARYAAIGNRFPLLEITCRQAAGLEEALNRKEPGRYRAYLGMKHSPPFIEEGVERMREDGIERAVGLVLAPHWSGMSVETYHQRIEAAVGSSGVPAFTFVRSWHDHPGFVEFLSRRVESALARLPSEQRAGAQVLFTAHSLPTRMAEDGTTRCLRCSWCDATCRYVEELRHTADLVAGMAGLGSHSIAWQSAGRTDDPWWAPPVEEVIQQLARGGTPAVVVCSAGFVADHLEILYDLDIEARQVAERAGIGFVRTEMPGANPAFIEVLASVVREHLAEADSRAGVVG